ncbi:hypothetical protein ACOSOMT5_P1033 [Acidiphilium sp. MT5]
MVQTVRGIYLDIYESRSVSGKSVGLQLELKHCLGQIRFGPGLTRMQVGEAMCIDQLRVTALIEGKTQRLSNDQLLKTLSAFEDDLEALITTARAKRGFFRVALASEA